jgi:hypothetical protein
MREELVLVPTQAYADWRQEPRVPIEGGRDEVVRRR